MKWLTFAIFAVAFPASLLWLDAADRINMSPKRTLLAVIALIGWSLVLALGVAQVL